MELAVNAYGGADDGDCQLLDGCEPPETFGSWCRGEIIARRVRFPVPFVLTAEEAEPLLKRYSNPGLLAVATRGPFQLLQVLNKLFASFKDACIKVVICQELPIPPMNLLQDVNRGSCFFLCFIGLLR